MTINGYQLGKKIMLSKFSWFLVLNINFILLLMVLFLPVSADNSDKGMDLYLAGEYEESINWFENILQNTQGIGRAPILNNIGISYLNLGETDIAKEKFEEALKINPSYYYAWVNLGLVNEYNGNTDEAIKCYNKAIELVPSSDAANSLVRKGNSLLLSGKYDEALSAFKAAEPYAKKTDRLALYTGIGIIYQIRKDYDEAENAFNLAIEADITNATIPYYDLGLMKMSNKEYENAKILLEKALSINPSMKNANYLLKRLENLQNVNKSSRS